jgi:ATPase subunit of ABC transporter with duplicated ATPase domains
VLTIELHLHLQLRESNGAEVVVSGVNGSGKTTALACLQQATLDVSYKVQVLSNIFLLLPFTTAQAGQTLEGEAFAGPNYLKATESDQRELEKLLPGWCIEPASQSDDNDHTRSLMQVAKAKSHCLQSNIDVC